MSGRQSATVDKALRLVAGGATAYAAAKKTGIALSTIYRAKKRAGHNAVTGKTTSMVAKTEGRR